MSKYPLIATKIPPQVADRMMFILYVAKLAQWPLRASLSGSTAPQLLADPRPLRVSAHNTAYGEEGRPEVERELLRAVIWRCRECKK